MKHHSSASGILLRATGTDSIQGTINQAATVHSSAFGTDLRITQTGARNLTTTGQHGKLQDATIIQDGGNNRGAVVQHESAPPPKE